MQVSILIPAFNPDEQLLQLIDNLISSGFDSIVVVNDGSSDRCTPIFDKIQSKAHCHLLRHVVNGGKGRALKTGLAYLLSHVPDACGVVTCDADGQHLVGDVTKVARILEYEPESLVLGVRSFGAKVPLRSRLGNVITRSLFYLLVGTQISDTQTGLRGIPRSFMPFLIDLEGEGYEFEMNMLIVSKIRSIPLVEEKICTVYIESNKSSHFNPLLDSMKIYYMLLRFSLPYSFTRFKNVWNKTDKGLFD